VRIFRWLFWVFAALYALAAISYFDALFLVTRGPSFSWLLTPLGMPWILLGFYLPTIRLAGAGIWAIVPWGTLLAPAINLLILYLLARRTR
jgi:hypothetical protein